MASRTPQIADAEAALADGTIPARFEGPALAFPPVCSENARGATLRWQVTVSARGPGGAAAPVEAAWLRRGAATPPGVVGVITTRSSQTAADGREGKERESEQVVAAGKNLGRANATNPVSQALRDALGFYNKQRQRAGVAPADASAPASAPADASAPASAPASAAAAPAPASAAAAPAPAAGGLGEAYLPMLVKKHGESRDATLSPADFARGVTVQRKYNGVRAVACVRASAGEVVLYSRTRAEYPGFDHIRAALAGVLRAAPPVPARLLKPPAGCGPAPDAAESARLESLYAGARVYLDGEVYLHGKPLIWISGQARREDDERSLEYVVFDCFFPGPKAAGHDMPSARRQEYLDLLLAAAAPPLRRAENFPAADLAEAEALRDAFLAEKYEGAIARKNCAGYRYSINGYHSANLVKLKPISDSEFAVVGYGQGARGKDVGAVIWVCEVPDAEALSPADRTFQVVPKDMTYAERKHVFHCLGAPVSDDRPGAAPGATTTRFERDFRGRPLTVEYPERSAKTGKPVQAKAVAFRTYEDGSVDPLRRLFVECAK
jgi:ATP-dependent DNA ligase